MARVGGINIPDNKHIDVSLTSIFGIGRKTAQDICDKFKIPYSKKVSELSDGELDKIRDELKNYQVEGDLRRDINYNIKRLMDLGCYRGIRHRKGLPLEDKELRLMQGQEKVQKKQLRHNGSKKENKKNSH